IGVLRVVRLITVPVDEADEVVRELRVRRVVADPAPNVVARGRGGDGGADGHREGRVRADAVVLRRREAAGGGGGGVLPRIAARLEAPPSRRGRELRAVVDHVRGGAVRDEGAPVELAGDGGGDVHRAARDGAERVVELDQHWRRRIREDLVDDRDLIRGRPG